MRDLNELLDRTDKKRASDAVRYKNLDGDLCMVCHAHGADKRSLIISCLYAVDEVVPEFIDLHEVDSVIKGQGFYLRICKTCRGEFLGKIREWFTERSALRGTTKDHDGGELFEDVDADRNIPVRVNGAVVMMNDEEYRAHAERAI